MALNVLRYAKWSPESLSWRPFCLAPLFLSEKSFSEFWKTFLSVLMLTRFLGEGIGDNSSEIFGRSLFFELKSFELNSALPDDVPPRKGGNDFPLELIFGLPKGWSGACSKDIGNQNINKVIYCSHKVSTYSNVNCDDYNSGTNYSKRGLNSCESTYTAGCTSCAFEQIL